VKRLKESDLVVTQPSNLFGDFSIQVFFKIQTNRKGNHCANKLASLGLSRFNFT
jgi:hypothetical protein